jgi:hypothetical protein
MKALLLALAGTALVTGCSFAARSPEMYRDDTQKVLATKQADIQACYDATLKTTPGVNGKVTVNFDVEPETGKITNVNVDKAGSSAPDAVGECVTKAITGLQLAPGDQRLGKATFVYEFSQAGTATPKG